MIRSLWISKSGLEAQQTQMDTISNNLANVNTTGFKRSRTQFEDMLYQTMRQPQGKAPEATGGSGLQVGSGSRPVATDRIFSQGTLQQTGNTYDMAIEGEGFFTVLLPNGSIAYSRDGGFHVNAQGQVVNANGYALQPPINIPNNATSVEIASDGMVTVKQPGSDEPVQVGAIQLASFINPAGLESKGSNLYGETLASGTPRFNVPGTNGTGEVRQGTLEASNVNVVEELVNMIQTQRAFEINSKAVTASDQMLQKLSQL